MATPIDPTNVQDWDEPLNTDPDYSVVHVFSTDDVTGTFAGLTQGDVLPGETPVIDFTAVPLVNDDGVNLYPINSEFGLVTTDFVGAVPKDFVDNPEYEEGYAGDLLGPNGEQIGIVVSDAPTDIYLTPPLLGTWLTDENGKSEKASAEHYTVMQDILSDQKYPGDPDALNPLDDNLIMIGGEYDGFAVADLLAGTVEIDGTPVVIVDLNEDGVVDIRDLLTPNESSIVENIAASSDYSVTLKDDGKLLYRWGNTVKEPNDIRLQMEMPLPEEWSATDDDPLTDAPDLKPLYRVTAAELVIHHTITDSPNDAIIPEGIENEAATGQIPTYEILDDGRWVTTDDYYGGDGTFYPAGTVLKNPALAAAAADSTLVDIGAASEDILEGYTNAWYTTMDRDPFAATLNEDGTDYDAGPRWRLKGENFGQDLPGVIIPEDPSLPPPPVGDEIKYPAGSETQTVVNLLDWEYPVSKLSISAGWEDKSGTVTGDGLQLTENGDFQVLVKGDKKGVELYGAELLLDYEEIAINAAGAAIVGGGASDYLAGQGDNAFTGGADEDFFVLNYGTTRARDFKASSITDFVIGEDTLGLIDVGADALTTATPMSTTDISQRLTADALHVYVDGYEIAVLEGVTETLKAESFVSIQTVEDTSGAYITGTNGDDTLSSDVPATILGLGGDDTITGSPGDDDLFGGSGNDEITGRAGNDVLDGGDGDDVLDGGIGFDTMYGRDGNDIMNGMNGFDEMYGGVGADTMFGNAGNDMLDGGNGHDTLNGGLNWDSMFGGDGNDSLTGLDGSDGLYGGVGDDILSGGAGSDTLEGGRGRDTMTGGIGSDTFLFTAGDDVITDFQDDIDQIGFDDALWGNGALTVDEILDFAEVTDGNVVFGFDGGHTLTILGLTNVDVLANDLAII